MRARWSCFPLLIAALLVAPAALAQGKDKSDKKADKTEKKAEDKAAVPDKDGVRRDPKGVTGISPYLETINKGNAAYLAKDWDGAAAAYREAIGKEASKPLAHYLLGETLVAAGKLDEADKAWQEALKAAANDDPMRAKVLFVVADLRERQGKFDEAAAAWKEYGGFVSSREKANGYAATATEREKVITTHKDLAVKYGEVKKRIEQRQQEVLDQAKKK